jgi:hypothetical protein
MISCCLTDETGFAEAVQELPLLEDSSYHYSTMLAVLHLMTLSVMYANSTSTSD